MEPVVKIEKSIHETILDELRELLPDATQTEREKVARAVAAIRAAQKKDTLESEARIIAKIENNHGFWRNLIFKFGRWIAGETKS